MDEKLICERAIDVVSYLYGETDERETVAVETHLRECSTCQAEAASFGQVRESIVAYRDEVLTGFIPATVAVPANRSAVAAFRQFFALSPLWLKGAAAVAAVVLCALAVVVSLKKEERVPVQANGTYTQQQVDELIQEALAKQQTQPRIGEKAPEPVVAVNTPVQKKQVPKGRRPLSRAERDQLAADLRLLPSEDAELNLLGDRINQSR